MKWKDLKIWRNHGRYEDLYIGFVRLSCDVTRYYIRYDDVDNIKGWEVAMSDDTLDLELEINIRAEGCLGRIADHFRSNLIGHVEGCGLS